MAISGLSSPEAPKQRGAQRRSPKTWADASELEGSSEEVLDKNTKGVNPAIFGNLQPLSVHLATDMLASSKELEISRDSLL